MWLLVAMSRLSRIGRTLTSCVGKSGTVDDAVGNISNERPRSLKREREDQKELMDIPDVLSDEFYERVRKNAVAVEFLDHTKNKITGYVSVRNDAPDKRVTVRYTTNEWNTREEIDAEWLASTEDQRCDKFRFSIPSLETPYTVHLAVRYEVLDQQHWDNNKSNNYEVVHGQ